MSWKRSYVRLAVFSRPWRFPVELVESRERGFEVGLVEDFAAVDQVAIDVRRTILLHSASKPSCEVPLDLHGDDRSEVGQPMYSFEVDAEVRGVIPEWRGCMRLGHRARTISARRWSMFTQSGVVGEVRVG